MDATDVELRVLGCLVEKQRTVPDAYPLSLNSLRLACNQATNRDPVVDYDDETIRIALAGLSRRGWVRLASGPGSRVVKYRHLFDEALDLSHAEVALLAVLMLRGAQTPGELKGRTERLHPFASLREVDGVLERLIERELVARLPRRPGQKETRYRHLLSDAATPAEAEASAAGGGDRLAELEERLTTLEDQVAALQRALAASPEHAGTVSTDADADAGAEAGGDTSAVEEPRVWRAPVQDR